VTQLTVSTRLARVVASYLNLDGIVLIAVIIWIFFHIFIILLEIVIIAEEDFDVYRIKS
jgi:hypothetical protein